MTPQRRLQWRASTIVPMTAWCEDGAWLFTVLLDRRGTYIARAINKLDPTMNRERHRIASEAEAMRWLAELPPHLHHIGGLAPPAPGPRAHAEAEGGT